MGLLRLVVVFGVLCGFVWTGATAGAVYHVRPGDTLSGIAARYGTTVPLLERLNGLAPTASLRAGVTLALPARKPREVRYRVAPGDTLSGIAERFHITVNALTAASGIDPAQPILIGAILHIPIATYSGTTVTHSTYTVRAGDTLSAIALHYAVSLGALAGINHLDPSVTLLVGKRLILPAGTIADAPQAFALSSVHDSIAYWADHYDVNLHLVAALAWMESGFNNQLVSTADAAGVMQITPDTWNYVEQILLLGAPVPHTSDGNIRIGVAYLHHLLRIYKGDPRQALAAYYQGAHSLQLNGRLPGTNQYVNDILALEQRF